VKVKAKVASYEHVAVFDGQATQEVAESFLKLVLQTTESKAKAASDVHDAVLDGQATQVAAVSFSITSRTSES
jgi:hypothetical protein